MIGCRLVPTSVDIKCVMTWKDCMLGCACLGEGGVVWGNMCAQTHCKQNKFY